MALGCARLVGRDRPEDGFRIQGARTCAAKTKDAGLGEFLGSGIWEIPIRCSGISYRMLWYDHFFTILPVKRLGSNPWSNPEP